MRLRNPLSVDKKRLNIDTSRYKPIRKRKKDTFVECYDNLFDDVQRILTFDDILGLRVDLHKEITPTFNVNHSLILGPQYESRSAYFLNINLYHKHRFFNATADSIGRIGGSIQWPFSKEWDGYATVLTSRAVGHDYLRAGVQYTGTWWNVMTSICSDSNISVSCLGVVSKGLRMGVNASYNVLNPSVKVCAEMKYKRSQGQLGCVITSDKQLAAFVSHSASKHTQLISKLVLDFCNHKSDFQVGCQHSIRKGQLRMAISTSGLFQSYVEEYVTPEMLLTFALKHDLLMANTQIGFGARVII